MRGINLGNCNSPQGMGAFSDVQLCELIRGGNESAFEEISHRYLGLIASIAKPYSAVGFDHADFIQEGLLALLSACKNYKEGEKKASFRNFAAVCISNRFLSVIRSANVKSAIPRDAVVPIEDIDISDDNRNNPETLLLQQECTRNFQKLLQSILSPMELDVLKLYLSGLSYAHISKKLDISPKSVDNALQRIRRKIADKI